MAKGSDKTVFICTKHKKEQALAPALFSLGYKLEVILWDTDSLGTFSNTINREKDIRETLKIKIEKALELSSGARAIASEGSFYPHPIFPMTMVNNESLLFVDRAEGFELFVSKNSLETNYSYLEISPKTNFDFFLEKIQFETHGLLIMDDIKNPKYVVYDIINSHLLNEALKKSFHKYTRLYLMTDMRAHRNPTRMKNIENAGKLLIEKYNSLCPQCKKRGFSMTAITKGLPCGGCGKKTNSTLKEIWECSECKFQEERSRHDGLNYEDPQNCSYCNP